VGFIDAGKLRVNESLDGLRARFRLIELRIGRPGSLPRDPDWLDVQADGDHVRLVHTRYEPGVEEAVRERLSAVVLDSQPLSLREVVLALCRGYENEEA
jgi:hypothetical protein